MPIIRFSRRRTAFPPIAQRFWEHNCYREASQNDRGSSSRQTSLLGYPCEESFFGSQARIASSLIRVASYAYRLVVSVLKCTVPSRGGCVLALFLRQKQVPSDALCSVRRWHQAAKIECDRPNPGGHNNVPASRQTPALKLL